MRDRDRQLRKKQWWEKAVARADAVPRPPGVESIGTPARHPTARHNPIRYFVRVDGDGNYLSLYRLDRELSTPFFEARWDKELQRWEDTDRLLDMLSKGEVDLDEITPEEAAENYPGSIGPIGGAHLSESEGSGDSLDDDV